MQSTFSHYIVRYVNKQSENYKNAFQDSDELMTSKLNTIYKALECSLFSY